MSKDNKYIPSGYKPSPLGPIPEDWEVKRLGEIGDVLMCKRIMKQQTDSCGDIPFFKIGTFGGKPDAYISKEVFDEYKTKYSYPKVGDVLISAAGTIGRSVIFNGTPSYYQDSNIVWIDNDNKQVLNKYLYYYYSTINWITDTGTIPRLYNGALKAIQIPTPPIKQQTRIVSILELWDTAIAKQTELVEKLTLRKRGLMQQLLTGKKRLKGFSGEWERIKAGEIFKSISVKGNGSEVLLSATQEHGVIPRDQLESRVTMPTGDTNSFKLVEVGDFVISLRSFQGGLEYSEHRGIVSPAYTVLKPIVEIDKSFYRYYFKSAEFIGHLAIAVIGIRDGKQISYEDFCFVKIPYPNIKEQKAISSVLLQADKEIEIQKQKLAAMQEQKKGLMQVLLTGRKRIVNHKNNNYDG